MEKYIKTQAQIERENKPLTENMKQRLIEYGYSQLTDVPSLDSLKVKDYDEIVYQIERELKPTIKQVEYIENIVKTEKPEMYEKLWAQKEHNLYNANKILNIYNSQNEAKSIAYKLKNLGKK